MRPFYELWLLHLDVFELVWIVVNATGFVLAVEALNNARADRDVVRDAQRVAAMTDRRNRGREFQLERAIADDAVLSARWIVGGLGSFLAAGLLLGFTPQPVSRPLAVYLVIVLLTVGAAALPFRLIGQRRRRRRLLLVPRDGGRRP